MDHLGRLIVYQTVVEVLEVLDQSWTKAEKQRLAGDEYGGGGAWEGLTPLMLVVAEFPRMYALIIFFQRPVFGKAGDGRELSLVLVFVCMTPRG